MVAKVEGHRLDDNAKLLGRLVVCRQQKEGATHHAHVSSVAPATPVSTVVVAAAGGCGHGMRMVVAVVHVAVVHRIHVCTKTKQSAPTVIAG